jgi:environmental stress-induced protein Ves
MTAIILRNTDLPISPWPNKAGRKADIASGPGWLVAFAWLDRDARFSDYTGLDRTITLIDGEGFVLRFDDGHDVAVSPLVPTPFDGGLGLTCHLQDGPCRVLNVMTERARFSHRVRIGSDGDTWGNGGTAVFVALEDEATLRCQGQSHRLGRWDCMVFEASGDVVTSGRFACLDILAPS